MTPKNIKKHIIICNWSEKGEKIIEELHTPLAAPDSNIIVISSPRPANEKWLRERNAEEYSNVEFREGEPMLHETLKRANAHMAKAVIILSNLKSCEADAESGLITLAINTLWRKRIESETEERIKTTNLARDEVLNKILSEEEFEKPRIVAEVQEHSKTQHIRDAGADDVICAADYAIGIMAQAAINVKLSDVYHDLLTYREGTSEIYIIDNPDVSEWLSGKTFKEISRFFIENRCSDNPAIPVGLRRGKTLMINPKEDVKFIVNDALIVLAYDIPYVFGMIAHSDEKRKMSGKENF